MSTGHTDKKEAQRWASDNKIQEMETLAMNGLLTQRAVSVMICGRQMTLAETIQPWVEDMEMRGRSPGTIILSKAHVKAFGKAAGVMDAPLISITPKQINDWVNAHGHQKASTRSLRLAYLKSIFAFAHDAGYVLVNPAQSVRVNLGLLLHNQKEVTKRACFTEEEIQKLLDLTSPTGAKPSLFWNSAIEITRMTGLRLGDICSLEHNSFTREGYIVVWTQKRDKQVVVPVDEEWKKAWLARIPKTHETWVFPKDHWRFLANIGSGNVSEDFTTLCKSLGIYGKSFHCLRATFVTRKVEEGTPIKQVAELVGHSYTSTTEGYVRP